jgi:hypothetical protein
MKCLISLGVRLTLFGMLLAISAMLLPAPEAHAAVAVTTHSAGYDSSRYTDCNEAWPHFFTSSGQQNCWPEGWNQNVYVTNITSLDSRGYEVYFTTANNGKYLECPGQNLALPNVTLTHVRVLYSPDYICS